MILKLLRFLTGIWMAMMLFRKKRSLAKGVDSPVPAGRSTIQVTAVDGGVTVEIISGANSQSVLVRNRNLRRIAIALQNWDCFEDVDLDESTMFWAMIGQRGQLRLSASTFTSGNNFPSIDIEPSDKAALAGMFLCSGSPGGRLSHKIKICGKPYDDECS